MYGVPFLSCTFNQLLAAIFGILLSLIKKLNGLIIEFHHLDVNLNKVKKFIENFSLELVHIHPQNPAPVINNIPTQIELTFAKDPVPLSAEVQLPHELDQPANPNIKDINLMFEN